MCWFCSKASSKFERNVPSSHVHSQRYGKLQYNFSTSHIGQVTKVEVDLYCYERGVEREHVQFANYEYWWRNIIFLYVSHKNEPSTSDQMYTIIQRRNNGSPKWIILPDWRIFQFNSSPPGSNGHHFHRRHVQMYCHEWSPLSSEFHWSLFPRVQLIIFQHWFE